VDSCFGRTLGLGGTPSASEEVRK